MQDGPAVFLRTNSATLEGRKQHKNLPVVHNLFIATTAVRAQVLLATRKAQSEIQPSVWRLGILHLCQFLNFNENRVVIFFPIKAPPKLRFKSLTVTFQKYLSDLGPQVTVISCRRCGEDWPLTNSYYGKISATIIPKDGKERAHLQRDSAAFEKHFSNTLSYTPPVLELLELVPLGHKFFSSKWYLNYIVIVFEHSSRHSFSLSIYACLT